MVTGDLIIAKTAQKSDLILQNSKPSTPVLEFPADNQQDVDPQVAFSWNSSKHPDDDSLSYRHYVWPVDQIPDDNRAIALGLSKESKLSRAALHLEPGKSYYWKVIVEDGRGGVAESVIRRFSVKGDPPNKRWALAVAMDEPPDLYDRWSNDATCPRS
jgi:hypothetical protein